MRPSNRFLCTYSPLSFQSITYPKCSRNCLAYTNNSGSSRRPRRTWMSGWSLPLTDSFCRASICNSSNYAQNHKLLILALKWVHAVVYECAKGSELSHSDEHAVSEDRDGEICGNPIDLLCHKTTLVSAHTVRLSCLFVHSTGRTLMSVLVRSFAGSV